MEGGTSCIQLSLLPVGANTFTNGLRCFKVIVMVAFASAELSLLSCIILVLCFLFPPAGFILVYWELSGTGRLLHKRSKLYLVPVPVLFHSISWHCILVYGRDFLGPSFNELRTNSCSPKFRTAVPYLLDLKRFGLWSIFWEATWYASSMCFFHFVTSTVSVTLLLILFQFLFSVASNRLTIQDDVRKTNKQKFSRSVVWAIISM